mmetsp:Transcript_27137/g.62562  ORF Transcript_27137/g.62562 Transcript_27137/m.62562 type:complete len:274 (+) Transcript_27137:378-1199(+)
MCKLAVLHLELDLLHVVVAAKLRLSLVAVEGSGVGLRLGLAEDDDAQAVEEALEFEHLLPLPPHDLGVGVVLQLLLLVVEETHARVHEEHEHGDVGEEDAHDEHEAELGRHVCELEDSEEYREVEGRCRPDEADVLEGVEVVVVVRLPVYLQARRNDDDVHCKQHLYGWLQGRKEHCADDKSDLASHDDEFPVPELSFVSVVQETEMSCFRSSKVFALLVQDGPLHKRNAQDVEQGEGVCNWQERLVLAFVAPHRNIGGKEGPFGVDLAAGKH